MNTHASLGMHKMFDRFDISSKVYALITKVEAAYSGMTDMIKLWASRSAGRKQLARMSNYMLRDIGMEPYDAIREANKPFWKA